MTAPKYTAAGGWEASMSINDATGLGCLTRTFGGDVFFLIGLEKDVISFAGIPTNAEM